MFPCLLRLKNEGKSTDNDDEIEEVRRGDERSSRSSESHSSTPNYQAGLNMRTMEIK